MPQTPHQRAEAELTAYGLTLPETDVVPGWRVTRYMRVRGKGLPSLATRVSRWIT